MTVVEFVDGVVVRDQDDLSASTDDQTNACADELVRILVELHSVDVAAVGLQRFGRPEGFLARQVDLWATQWSRVRTRDLADVDTLHAKLSEAVPRRSATSIVHGDFRIDNTILDPIDRASVRAVVDWELSTLGDPLTDVALMCVYRSPAFDLVLGSPAAWTSDRLPSPDALAHRYAVMSGRDVGNWDFYVALANFKLGVIAEGIAHRARSGSEVGTGAERAAEATPEFVAAGLRALQGDR